MDVKLSRQEVLLLQDLLEGSLGEMGVRIRHPEGLEAKGELERRRTLLRRILDKLANEPSVAESGYGVTISPGR